jgi:hypothetical protein
VSLLGDARMYEKNCLHSLKAMLLEAKKDARLKPAATSANAPKPEFGFGALP